MGVDSDREVPMRYHRDSRLCYVTVISSGISVKKKIGTSRSESTPSQEHTGGNSEVFDKQEIIARFNSFFSELYISVLRSTSEQLSAVLMPVSNTKQ